MYVPTKSKSDSLLAKREIFTDRKDYSILLFCYVSLFKFEIENYLFYLNDTF